MKPSLLLPVFAATVFQLASAQLVYPNLFAKQSSEAVTAVPFSQHRHQQPIHLPNNHNHGDDMALMQDKPSGTPLLADVIGLDNSISIFSGFTRSIETISKLLADRGENTTVLAPSNSAISKLPRKPWEDPEDQGAGGNVLSEIYQGIKGEDRAHRNLRRFVEAHCVGVSPWEKGQKVKTLEGVEIWWEDGEKEGEMKIMPGSLKVVRVQSEVQNGQLWIVDGVVNYDQ